MHFLLVYHSAQLSHTWSDFSRSLRVMISETRILFHFIPVLLSSTSLNQQCWHYFSYTYFWFGYCWCNLFQVTGTDASCVLYLICSQFITFEQVTLCSAYSAWFAALLTSTYAVLLCTCPYLFLAQFDSSVYIRIQFELH